MFNALVSIVMPVYNVSKYVERALLSVFRQTYKDIELIIVDDCGTDDSMQIVKRVVDANDSNSICRIFRHEKNRGLSAARNTGVENSKGQYVYFLDSDDEITADCIEKLMQIVFKHPSVEIVTGNMSILEEDGTIREKLRYFTDTKLEERFEYSEDIVLITNLLFNYTLNCYIPVCSPNKIYYRRWLVENKLTFVEGLIHEDEKFLFDIARCIHNIGICYESTYLRYVNPNSIMTSLSKERSANAWIYIIASSFPLLHKPLLRLKVRYCTSILKDLFFSCRYLSKNILVNIKFLIGKIFLFSLKNQMIRECLFALPVVVFPIWLRNNNFFVRLLRRVDRIISAKYYLDEE